MDLWERLSNPDDAVETLAGQGLSGAGRVPSSLSERVSRPAERDRQDPSSPLSNPVQRRLPATDIDALIRVYRDGSSIDALARRYEIHRTTVIHHLDQAGVAGRRVSRKMTDESVAAAAARYEQGASLAAVANEFGVHHRTLARELRRAGASIRPRRGWAT